MFGYVKPDKAELKIKEYETYKAVYCSLCKTLGKEYGILSRFLLTYDATFFVLFSKSIFQPESDCAHKGVCRFNPLKKCNYIDEDEILRKAAALTVIMFYYKLLDSFKDEKFFKKAASYIIYPYIKLKFNKAVKKYPKYNVIVSEQIKRQSEIEASFEKSIDIACDPSSKALSEIFSTDVEDEEQKRHIKRAAYCIGRWVYLMDAFDDLEDDIKSCSYNPFIYHFELNSGKNECTSEIYEQIIGRIRVTANEAADSFNKIKKNCYGSLVENIIFDGFENELLQLIVKKEKRGEKLGK